MAHVFDVANFFINNAIEKNEKMTNLRLNKLLYFAQVWNILETGEPLYTDTIEAWTLGPVVNVVYQKLKGYEDQQITEPIEHQSESSFSPEQIALLFDVDYRYGQFATRRLVDLTHVKGSPWDRAYSSLESDFHITPNLIEECYRTAYESKGLPRRTKELSRRIPIKIQRDSSGEIALFDD